MATKIAPLFKMAELASVESGAVSQPQHTASLSAAQAGSSVMQDQRGQRPENQQLTEYSIITDRVVADATATAHSSACMGDSTGPPEAMVASASKVQVAPPSKLGLLSRKLASKRT
jgi:hypothetical protein